MARPQTQTAAVQIEPGLAHRALATPLTTNVTTTTTTTTTKAKTEANLSNVLTFEDLVEAGLATLKEVIILTPMLLTVAAMPAPPARTASAASGFRQVTVTANNPRYGDLLATINSRQDPTQWMTPRRVPYEHRARVGDIVFWPWGTTARRSLDTTLQQLADQGYRGGWTGLRIVMPRRDMLPSPRPQEATPELCYVFYRTDNWQSGPGVLVGAVTGRMKPFRNAGNEIPLDAGDASWKVLQNMTTWDAVEMSTAPATGIFASAGGGGETW